MDTSEKIYQLLFVCTHNSACSIMSEGFLNSLGGNRFHGHSAGSQPSGSVHSFSLTTLQRMHIPVAHCGR